MTLLEAHVALTELHPNYELVFYWRFEKTGTTYCAQWRPEGNFGLLTDYPAETEGPSQERVLDELVQKAQAWKERVNADLRQRPPTSR